MNFEKVEIYGFKSFADKAEIKFGNGITGIVGPNGCGKSNVADAIRWVLGEQSAKTLRGSSMQDVIFAGTQGRKSLSYCEVSLFFDNTTRMFSIDYNEVIITRKLYRSGESEYFINKQPARLKDIVDLLHECGIGKEGYSIIGQGKVEEIMSAKPEDRRMIFEEATGIAKFKAKKNESERKLERTHENVVRYSDIISEIETQLAPLEKQAEKAREFNELSAELKRHELNTYVAKVEGVATAKEKIDTRIKGIDEQSDLRRKEFEKAQAEYDKIFNDISEADTRLKNLNDDLLQKTVSMEKSSGAKQLYQERISYINSQIERAENEIVTNKSLIEESSKSENSNIEEIKQSKKQLEETTKRSEEVTVKLKQVSEKIAFGEELASSSQKKVIESLVSLTDIKVNTGTMSNQKKNLLDKLNELNERYDNLSVKRDGLFNEKERSDKNLNSLDRAIFETKNNITAKEEQVRNSNEEVAKVENSIYTLNSAITMLITKDNFYKGLKDSYEGYNPSVKLLMTKSKENAELGRRIKGVVAEIIKSDKMYDIALETALAASAQNIVTETPEDAKYLIEYLKANKIGRVTFLPITSVRPREQLYEVTSALRERGALGVANEIVSYDKKFENVISNLLGNTLIVDTLENATDIAKKYRFVFKIVTLDGDVLSTQGSMTGGSRRQDTVGLLSSDRKIEENAKLLEEKNKEMEKLKGEKKALEVKRDKALDELSYLNELYNTKRQEKVVESEKLSVSEKNLSEIGQEIETVNDLMDDVKERISKLDEDFKAVESGSKKLEQDRESAENDKNKQEAEFEKLKKEKEELTNESTSLQVRITELKARIQTLNEDNVRLDSIIKEAKETNDRLVKSNQNASEIIEQIKRDQEKISLTQEQQDQLNGIREKIEGIETYKLELKTKLNKNEETRQTLSNELNDLIEKKNNEKIALAKIDSDLEYMGQSIFEDYQETYETAVKVKEEGYDAVFGEQEIARIRRKRSSLGSINAEAIEDVKALHERYDEMVTQRDDLLKAESDIQEAIDTIKGEMLTQFDEGFVKINENFQKIFKELFGGGRAMLELDYGEDNVDKLEAGIEIIAEPPGKKLQKLSLLSGGEKALTAIAILFAILKLRPMPFCILDEIEAALDEANVDRFARYLQKFSQETQFIVITHRKPTMEMADSLFGVTMEEKGVSKTVSVKLSDIVNNDELVN
ncbi:MAG: chromosome segregation protein SMC [Firmicutes bacterium]|nr:chromosome segregation protein SMC [Candidatus Caballimonas caccae]